MLLPKYSKGTPEIDDAVYERMKMLWEEECKKTEGSYRQMAFNQGSDDFKSGIID